ncbi:MAG: hypothetical protein GH144_01190 [Clostridia bacterium]|jgi:hypothetical protein|nr:hypothetical protein [Clostridia bacterium]
MKTAGARVSNEEYEALKDYAKARGSNVNAILGNLVRGLTEGKAEPGFRKDSSTGVRGKILYEDLRQSLIKECVRVLKILTGEE